MKQQIAFRPGRVVLAILAGVALVVIVFGMRSQQSPVVNAQKLASALAQYARDSRSHGQALPPTIPVQTLVALGYLQPEDTKALNGVDLVFHTDVDGSRPESLLAEAHTPDGQIQAVLADGSVQIFSPQKWEEYLAGLKRAGKSTRPAELGTNAASNTGPHP